MHTHTRTFDYTHPQVQLLVSPKDIENYNTIRKSLEKLKQLVEEAELWVQRMPRAEDSGSGGGGGGGGSSGKVSASVHGGQLWGPCMTVTLHMH